MAIDGEIAGDDAGDTTVRYYYNSCCRIVETRSSSNQATYQLVRFRLS